MIDDSRVKLRIVMTITKECEVDRREYAEPADNATIIAAEKDAVDKDPYTFFEFSASVVEVKVEVLP